MELYDLPDLALINIFKYLDIQTLANIGKSGRKFYNISRLYREQRKKQIVTKALELFRIPTPSNSEDVIIEVLDIVHHLNNYTCYDLNNIQVNITDIYSTNYTTDINNINIKKNINIRKKNNEVDIIVYINENEVRIRW
jgi:hypothetical protein